MILRTITLYPVKGLRGTDVTDASVEPWGLAGDRRWMVVDPAGRCLTQRDLPGMARLGAAMTPGGLALSGQGAPVDVPYPDADAPVVDVVVWRDTVSARLADGEAARWLSAALGRPCALVHMADPARARAMDPAHARATDRVSFADGFPLLLTATASLADLNVRLAIPVPMSRFRANVVIETAEPWAEERWPAVRIGDVVFRAPKPCERCAVIQVDQETGQKSRDREPLRTLAAYRRGAHGVVFGQNLLPDGTGRIALGDPIQAAD